MPLHLFAVGVLDCTSCASAVSCHCFAFAEDEALYDIPPLRVSRMVRHFVPAQRGNGNDPREPVRQPPTYRPEVAKHGFTASGHLSPRNV